MNNNKVGAVEVMKDVSEKVFKATETLNSTSTVEISISCRKLTNKDVLSKSDPQCVVYIKSQSAHSWTELLRTEVIQNNLNPDFATKVTLDYRFEQSQHLRFEVYDIDGPDDQLEAHDLIGSVECTAANILAAGSRGYEQDLDSPENSTTSSFNGRIVLVAEELAAMKDEVYGHGPHYMVYLRLSCMSVGTCLSACLRSKSFYTIAKSNESSNTYVVVYRSVEVGGVSPLWPSLTISSQTVCNGDKDRLLRIEIHRKNWKQEDESVGSHFTSLKRLTLAKGGVIPLVDPNGKITKSALTIHGCSVMPIYTFVDFVQAGTKIHLCFSIDFTSSNGDTSLPTSLHHISKDPTITNPYEQAIEAVGAIVKDYDNTDIFPVWGFGAKVPPTGHVSHEFPVTLEKTPNCKGINGVIRAYRHCVGKVKLAGPTNFAPVINRVAAMAARSKPDFSPMEELDGDDGRVSYLGTFAERDIVQFVEYRNANFWLKKAGGGGNVGEKESTNLMAQAKLAEEILAEIPGQVTSYMKDRGIEPCMITMETTIPEVIFAGPTAPDITATFEKMKRLVEARRIARIKNSDDRIKAEIALKKHIDTWSILSFIGVGKHKFRSKLKKVETLEVLEDILAEPINTQPAPIVPLLSEIGQANGDVPAPIVTHNPPPPINQQPQIITVEVQNKPPIVTPTIIPNPVPLPPPPVVPVSKPVVPVLKPNGNLESKVPSKPETKTVPKVEEKSAPPSKVVEVQPDKKEIKQLEKPTVVVTPVTSVPPNIKVKDPVGAKDNVEPTI